MDEPNGTPERDLQARVEGKRVYCAWEDCGKKLEKSRSYYCKLHEFWPQ